jgi:hypothetical protein
VTLALGVAVGLLAALVVGANWRGLAETRWRLAPLCLLGMAIQLLFIARLDTVVPLLAPLGPTLHVVSYLLVFAFLLANLRVPGLPLLLLGGLLNFAAIAANDGQMPRAAPPDGPGVFRNVAAMDEGTRLAFLGDWIAAPNGQLYSVGDLLIFAGGALASYRLRSRARAARGWPCRRRPGWRARAAAASRPAGACRASAGRLARPRAARRRPRPCRRRARPRRCTGRG